MKFHNQRSFMGHEISNVNNKPLLHKKGKQWIVVAVSALILAGFGGMVSTTTHADTTAAQPTTTKVAPKPANNSGNTSNVMKQAQGMHKALTNNAAVQKPSAPSSAVTKKTAPVSAAPTNSAISKSSSASSNNNSSNNKATKPTVHMMLMSTPAPQTSQVIKTGTWGTAPWKLYNNGHLYIGHSDGTPSKLSDSTSTGYYNLLNELGMNGDRSLAQKVQEISFNKNVSTPSCYRLFDDEEDQNYTPSHPKAFSNLQTIDVSNLNTSHANSYLAMFGGLTGLENVAGLGDFNNQDTSWLFCDDINLQSVDLSKAQNMGNDGYMFTNDPKLTTILVGPSVQIDNSSHLSSDISNHTWIDNNNNSINMNQNNALIKDNNANNSIDTWRLQGTGPAWMTDTVQYVYKHNNKDINISSDFKPQGTDGTRNRINWYDYGYNKMPDNWNISKDGTENFTFNGGTHDVDISPNIVQDSITYKDGNTTVGSTTISGNDSGANGADNTSFTFKQNATPTGSSANGYNLSNYYIPNDQNVPYDTHSHTVTVAQKVIQPIDYDWFGQSVGKTNILGVPKAQGTINGTGLDSGWSINPGTYGTNSAGTFTFPNTTTNNAITMGVKPKQSDKPLNYQYNGTTLAINTYKGDSYYTHTYPNTNTSFKLGNTPENIPNGFHTINPTEVLNYDGATANIAIEPNTDHDYLIYELNTNHNYQIGTSTDKFNGYISGNDYIAGQKAQAKGVNIPNTTFTVSNTQNHPNLPEGYHVVSGDGAGNNGLTFNYQTTPTTAHVVYVAPNTVTINYKNKENNKVVSSNTATFDGNSKDISAHVSNYYHIPAGYQLVNGQSNNTLSFDNDNNSVTVQVTPKQATDTIDYIANYPNGSTLVSSASSTGNDYQAQGATNTQFTVTSAPANYQLVPNENTTFNYDSSNHDVAVEPAQNNQKTDVINYMNGDVKIASDVYTGNDMYAPNANHTSFNANDYVPAGYHVVNDGGNTFYFDGQTHDVTVYPNSITLEFNNGQAGSKTINNLKGTTYQINSSDVPANYQLTNPSDTNVDLGDLGRSTTYNVDVSPIQQPVTPTTPSSASSASVQPSVPYIPSMPVSSVASASSASSEPVASASASNTTSQPSNEAKPSYRSHYSHYRYAKVITPLQLHTSKHFTDKNGVLVIKHPTEFRIMKIVHDHKYTRYEVKYQGHKYFITGNSKFTINDYVQKHDFKSHKHMMVRVITPLIEYKHAHFNRKYAIRVFKKGAVLPVKRVFTIGKGEMTRFELTNGRYVTSNKLFVKVIK